MEKLGFRSLPQNPSSNSSRFSSTDEAHVLIARAPIGWFWGEYQTELYRKSSYMIWLAYVNDLFDATSLGLLATADSDLCDRRRVVSASTCGKICAVSFIVGVVVGFTLKRRLRNWARKMLKGLKDD